MAVARTGEASSSRSQGSYHVLLSFRGKDTCETFVDHLYIALKQVGIHTFRNRDKPGRGKTIGIEMRKAVKESRLSIIIFSDQYASSRWCLDELVNILERKRTLGHMVLPVFYKVDPSHIRKQKGTYSDAFLKYEEQTMALTGEKKKETKTRVERWRAFLTEAANLAGMVFEDGDEFKFVEEIVGRTWSRLCASVLNVAPHPIGLYHRIKDINLWLQDSSAGAHILMVYGESGIGKTTIVKTIYSLYCEKFEASSFITNIGEISGKSNDLVQLQRLFLSEILKWEECDIYNIDDGSSEIKEALWSKNFLLVFDDVDQVEHLNAVLCMRDWFSSGTKFIITTRNEGLIYNDNIYEVLKAKRMDYHESLQLFSWHAFGHDHPKKSCMNLSKKLVHHCQGLPLALQVLGCSLHGATVDLWESTSEKLEKLSASHILKVLQISYETLQDDHEKNLFVDIACFFVGKDKDCTVKILDECGYYTTAGIQNLIDRFLLTITRDNKLMMHHLLQEVGREVLCQESAGELGKRSRIWHFEDALTVLQEDTGTECTEGLALELDVSGESNVQKRRQSSSRRQSTRIIEGNSSKRSCLGFFSWLPINSSSLGLLSQLSEGDLSIFALSRMHELRLLKLKNVHLSGSYNGFPKKLKWLCWHGFQLNSIPSDFPLEHLAVLEMQNSNLIRVWQGTKCLKSLKILDLSHSHGLTNTPDFSGLSSLESLILEDCINLVKVHESIGSLHKLVLLDLRGCVSLRKLPRTIQKLKSLEKLILFGSLKLKFSLSWGKMLSMPAHCADGSARAGVQSMEGNSEPSDMLVGKTFHLVFWPWMSSSKSSKLASSLLDFLPHNLQSLDISDCNVTDKAIPKYLSILSSLLYLNLSKNPISKLPESIKGLTALQSLKLVGCSQLQSLPELPSSLKMLDARSCRSLERITNLPNFLRSLDLHLEDCGKLVEVEELFKLEPIRNAEEMLSTWGLTDLNHMEGLDVELFNSLTSTKCKGPLKGLHEFGIFSTFLPGSKVPGGFNEMSSGPAILFDVPSVSHLSKCRLDVCVAYTQSDEDCQSGAENYIAISNKTKRIKWIYNPLYFAVKGSYDTVLWLSCWKFGAQLEGGDQVSISLNMRHHVKEFGIKVVCNEQEEADTYLKAEEEDLAWQPRYPSTQHVIGGDLSAYELNKDVYFLSHHC